MKSQYTLLAIVASLLLLSSCNPSKMVFKENFEADDVYYTEGDPGSPYVYAEDLVEIDESDEENFIDDDYYEEDYTEYDDGGDTFITNNYYNDPYGWNNNYYPFAPAGWTFGWNSNFGWYSGWGYSNPWYGYGGWYSPWQPYYSWGNPYWGWNRPWGWNNYGWGYGWNNPWNNPWCSPYYGYGYGGWNDGYAWQPTELGTYQPIGSFTSTNPSYADGQLNSAQLRYNPEVELEVSSSGKGEDVSLISEKPGSTGKDEFSPDKVSSNKEGKETLVIEKPGKEFGDDGPVLIASRDDFELNAESGRITDMTGSKPEVLSIRERGDANAAISAKPNQNSGKEESSFGAVNIGRNNTSGSGKTDNADTQRTPRNNYYVPSGRTNTSSGSSSGRNSYNANSNRGGNYGTTSRNKTDNSNWGNNNSRSNSSGSRFDWNSSSGSRNNSSSSRSSGSSRSSSSSSGRSSSSKSSSSRGSSSRSSGSSSGKRSGGRN